MQLAIKAKDIEGDLTLGDAYFDAMEEYAKNVSVGLEKCLSSERWNELFTLLDESRQALFRRRAYNILKESEGRASTEFFHLYWDILSDRKLLDDNPRVIDEVCIPILDAGNEESMIWLAHITKSHANSFKKKENETDFKDFKDRVRQNLQSTSEDDPKFGSLKRIGDALRIKA